MEVASYERTLRTSRRTSHGPPGRQVHVRQSTGPRGLRPRTNGRHALIRTQLRQTLALGLRIGMFRRPRPGVRAVVTPQRRHSKGRCAVCATDQPSARAKLDQHEAVGDPAGAKRYLRLEGERDPGENMPRARARWSSMRTGARFRRATQAFSSASDAWSIRCRHRTHALPEPGDRVSGQTPVRFWFRLERRRPQIEPV